jgi:hypothetical protein
MMDGMVAVVDLLEVQLVVLVHLVETGDLMVV